MKRCLQGGGGAEKENDGREGLEERDKGATKWMEDQKG